MNEYEINNGQITLAGVVIATLPAPSPGSNPATALASLCSFANGGLDFERRKNVLISKGLILLPGEPIHGEKSWLKESAYEGARP